MTRLTIASVSDETMGDLDYALRALSSEMGDTHVADLDSLRSAFLLEATPFHALLAYLSAELVGAIVWSAQFSTTRGGGGVYVSDLWVAASARSQGVGRKLLVRALSDAKGSSGACFLRLSVHHTNPAAMAYYAHIGFREEDDMLSMVLDGEPLRSFKRG